ncbi:unnamed protein product [Lactuca saligna]|uniref:Aconitase/3-isopropylmalate dehydratase large subunit alpha/beta/alpha domain-containing protein n=1 Tax=Lactuca saligna TaxID=75948 RepID=A0AA36E7N5_LACSI|nr:unnamed protein product [Lactuca saligna]
MEQGRRSPCQLDLPVQPPLIDASTLSYLSPPPGIFVSLIHQIKIDQEKGKMVIFSIQHIQSDALSNNMVTVRTRSSQSFNPVRPLTQSGLADVELALVVEKHVLESGSIDTVGTIGILELYPGAINSIPSKARMEIDTRDVDEKRRNNVIEKKSMNLLFFFFAIFSPFCCSLGFTQLRFQMEVSEKQEIAKLGYDIPVIYELGNLEVKIYASELYTGASRTPASCWSFTTARSASCSAPASCSSSSKWTKFKPFGSLPSGLPDMDANGPADAAVSSTSSHGATVLSGNRNFEGRVHPLTGANYLASPPLVVAYVLVGTLCGSNPSEGVFFGLLLSMSLTTVVLKFLMEKTSVNALHRKVCWYFRKFG